MSLLVNLSFLIEFQQIMNDGRSFNGIEADRKNADSIRWPKDDVLCQRLDRIVDCLENGSGSEGPSKDDPEVKDSETKMEEEKVGESVEEKIDLELSESENVGKDGKDEKEEKDEIESQPTNVETDDDAASKKR